MYRKILLLSFAMLFMASGANAATGTDGVTDDEILIGQSMDISGQLASRTADQLAGENLYINRINASGGVYGRKIKLITYDDRYDPRKTVEQVEKLLKIDDVFLLFSLTGTPTIKAVLPLIEKYDVPLISPNSGANFLRYPVNRNVYCVKPSFESEASTMIKFLLGKSIKDIAIFYQDDAFGSDGRASVAKELNKHGLKTVANGAYIRGQDDISFGYGPVKSAKPKAVILWATSESSAVFIKRAVSEKWFPIMLVPSTVLSAEFKNGIKGVDMSKVTLYTVTNLRPLENNKLPIAKSFLEDAQKAGVTPHMATYASYINTAVLVEALKAAGPKLTRQALRDAMDKKMNGLSIGGMISEYSATNHQAFSETFLAEVVDGKIGPIQ